ncbi:nucleolin 1-like [Ostrinia furnacalis]|uniref:nucleolin 1-like n=1 Tax=Ostrinia furnacalis TaxID=93504 RepID=UPI00103898FF|nr:nucleolin 1-like [Ostrinia furnacalis]
MRPPTMHLYFTVLIAVVHALSIEKVSDKNNVTKRAANGDFFPDWVPFKNKHGDELGEFQQVTKAKPKKRLAPPVNFILRAVAEPEGDDYYDKGQGEGGDGDEYFEKKDWSDLNRPAEPVDGVKVVNHTDISDIDGVVDIITKGKPSVILNALQLHNNSKKQKKEEREEETTSKEETKKKADSKEEKPIEPRKPKKIKRYEDDIDYEESDSEKQKPEVVEDDQSENDAKKASILDSVDELKERHAEEQRAISEKVKEEEIYTEEHERNKIGVREKPDKYDTRGRKKDSDYDEYDEKEVSVHEKYRMHSSKVTTTTRRPKTTRHKGKKNEEVGKLSVFKNPQLYMVYDDDSEDTTTTKKPTTRSRAHSRYSSKFTTATPETEENVRISLVPQDSEAKEGEPTLFFPKTRKNKKKRKNRTTTPEPDSFVAETVAGSSAKDLTTAVDFTSPSASSPDTTASGSAVSASDALAATNGATDAVPASTDHKDEKKEEDYHKEKGECL